MAAPWLKFYPTDWQSDPALRLCSSAARGLWIDMLCLMHKAEPYGSLLVNGKTLSPKQLALFVGIAQREAEACLNELEENGVFSRDADGTIYSRRMRRDFQKAEGDKTNGRKGGSPEIRRGTVPKEDRVRPYKRSDSPTKTLRIFQKSQGKCHWCGVKLLFDGTGAETNYFQVDHVIPVCDGGRNTESNLVAACSDCNHKRARQRDPTLTHLSVVDKCVGISDANPDRKAQSQKPESESDPEDHQHPPETVAAPAKAQSLIRPEAHAIAEELWQAAGFSKETLPPGWCGTAMAIQKWLNDGCPGDVVKLAVNAALRRKRDGPPQSFSYFAQPIAAAFADHQRPNPTAPPQAFDGKSNGYSVPKRTVIDAGRDLIAKLNALEGTADSGSGEGDTPPRLLPPH